MKPFTLALVSYAPSFGAALLGTGWTFSKAPPNGFTEITFPMNMANAKHESGYYYAQQFNFNNVENVGYIGLQPRPNQNGNPVVHAAFSSFQPGTKTYHHNCHSGADGGGGVSCAVEMIGNYANTYNLNVWWTGGTTWTGSLNDTVRGTETIIGQWTLPAGAGMLKNGQVGFVEYYPWNSGTHQCSDLPKTEAIFGAPRSKSKGASGGSINNVYEYGDCVGKVGFSYKHNNALNGPDMKIGVK